MVRATFGAGLVAALIFTSVGCQVQSASKGPKRWDNPPAMRIDQSKQYRATVSTSMGDIEVNLLAKEAPTTVNNFVFLAREGFYEDVKFHRIVKGFMVQTGDPTGTGAGGPGYRFVDEPVAGDYERGTVAMANAGPNTNGSQFFMMHGTRDLPKNYTIFGRVTSGLDILDRIAEVPVGVSDRGEPSVPQTEVLIKKVTIREG